MKFRIFLVLIMILPILLFSFSSVLTSNAATPGANGLPCASGPDFRSRMQGPWDFPRFDSDPVSIRYSPRWDIFYYAQCIDPATPGALQIVLNDVIADGKITKDGCNGGKNITFDSQGNLKLCSDESDSYVGIRGSGSNAYWIVGYYDTTSPGDNPLPVIPPIPEDTTEVDATPGWEGGLAFNSTAGNWLVVSQNTRKIAGQLMGNDGQRIGAPINIAVSGLNLTPRAGYSPDINKFLVVWVRENTTTDLSILGQFINPDGTMSGNQIQIDRGTFIFHANTSVQYDAKNKQFVLVWENRANRSVQVALNTLSSTGQPGTRVNITSPKDGVFNASPSVAINERDNQYCVMYQHVVDPVANTPSEVTVVPVSATNHQLGQPSVLTNDAFFVYNIAYNSTDNNYMGIWSDYKLTGLHGKIFSGCKNDPTADDIVISDQYSNGNLSYNSKSNSYAIIEEGSGVDNYLYVLDSDGGSISDSIVFSGGNNGNFDPRVVANTTTGMYTAITSEDHATTKFSSNLGASELLNRKSVVAAPFPPSVVLPVPTQGLPTDLGQLIQQIFTWSLGILGISVFVMFFYSGFLWLTAAGNTSKIGEAKTHMTNAVFGAILLLSSYLILYTINPDFVKSTVNLPGLGTTSPTSTTPGQPEIPGQPIPTASLLSDLQAERAKYGATVTHEEAGKILNAVAWKNSAAGWGLLSKTGGNNCPLNGTGRPISCDWLVHQPSLLGLDVLVAGVGTDENGNWVNGKATPTWGDGYLVEDSKWVAPIAP